MKCRGVFKATSSERMKRVVLSRSVVTLTLDTREERVEEGAVSTVESLLI